MFLFPIYKSNTVHLPLKSKFFLPVTCKFNMKCFRSRVCHLVLLGCRHQNVIAHKSVHSQHRIQRPDRSIVSSGGGGGGKKHEIYVAIFGGHLFYDLIFTLSVKTCCHCLLFAVWFAVLSLFLMQHTSATLCAMRPLQCKSLFFECVAPFLDSNWNFMMST